MENEYSIDERKLKKLHCLFFTYMNLIVQLRLEGVRALRNAPVQVVRLVNGQVVGADRGHRKASHFPDPSRQLNALTIVVLNLRMVTWISHDFIMPGRNATIAGQRLRVAHVLARCDVLLGGLG